MTSHDFIAAEADNVDRIVLYREGLFWKAYERSAFAVCSQVRPFKPTKKALKTLGGGELISIGFPTLSESAVLGALVRIAEEPMRLVLAAPRPIVAREFEAWKASQPLKAPGPSRSAVRAARIASGSASAVRSGVLPESASGGLSDGVSAGSGVSCGVGVSAGSGVSCGVGVSGMFGVVPENASGLLSDGVSCGASGMNGASGVVPESASGSLSDGAPGMYGVPGVVSGGASAQPGVVSGGRLGVRSGFSSGLGSAAPSENVPGGSPGVRSVAASAAPAASVAVEAPGSYAGADFTLTAACRVAESLRCFNLAEKTPMECMMYISELKKILVNT